MHEPIRIDVAERLDAALDAELSASAFPPSDPVGELVELGVELRAALQQPSLTVMERARIHARAVDLAERGHGLRRAWPQLAAHPAMVGGAAAAVLAVAGLVALGTRRGHGAAVLGAA